MLYNLYRPKDFTEVKGQEDVLITLKKQSFSQKFGHAYLFAGHRGTGKTTIARTQTVPAGNALTALHTAQALMCWNWMPPRTTELTK